MGRPVVMVCSKERPDKFPFDIQHRSIIPYRTESTSDFETLKTAVTERIKALLAKGATLKQIEEKEQVANIEGLSQPELFVLAEIAGSIFMPHSGVAVYSVKNEVERVFTAVGFALGLRRLTARGFVELKADQDHNRDDAAFLTDKAWNWIETHEDRFTMQRPSKQTITDDDVPF